MPGTPSLNAPPRATAPGGCSAYQAPEELASFGSRRAAPLMTMSRFGVTAFIMTTVRDGSPRHMVPSSDIGIGLLLGPPDSGPVEVPSLLSDLLSTTPPPTTAR